MDDCGIRDEEFRSDSFHLIVSDAQRLRVLRSTAVSGEDGLSTLHETRK